MTPGDAGGQRHDLPSTRALWITAGLLLCLLVVILTVLLMMALAVVA